MKKTMMLPFVDYSSLQMDRVFTRIHQSTELDDILHGYYMNRYQYILKQKGYMITHVRYGDIVFFVQINLYVYMRVVQKYDISYCLVQGFRIKKYNTKTKRLVYDKQEKIQNRFYFGANYNKDSITYQSTEECINNYFSLCLKNLFELYNYDNMAKCFVNTFNANNIDTREQFFFIYVVIPMMFDKVYQTDFYYKMLRATYLYRGL